MAQQPPRGTPSHVDQQDLMGVIRKCGFVTYSLKTTLFPDLNALPVPSDTAVPENIVQFLRQLAALMHVVVEGRIDIKGEPRIEEADDEDEEDTVMIPTASAWSVLGPAKSVVEYVQRVLTVQPDGGSNIFRWVPLQDVAPGNMQQLFDAIECTLASLVSMCTDMYDMDLCTCVIVDADDDDEDPPPAGALRLPTSVGREDKTKPTGVPNLFDNVETWITLTRVASNLPIMETDEYMQAMRETVIAISVKRYNPETKSRALMHECNAYLALWKYMLTGDKRELNELCAAMRSFQLDATPPHATMRATNTVQHTSTTTFVRESMRPLETLTYDQQRGTWATNNGTQDYGVHVMLTLSTKRRGLLTNTIPLDRTDVPPLVFAHSTNELKSHFGDPGLDTKCLFAAANLMYITPAHARILLPVACLGDDVDTLKHGRAKHGNWLMHTAFVQHNTNDILDLVGGDIQIVLSVQNALRYNHVPTFKPGETTWAEQVRVFNRLLPKDTPIGGTWLVQLSPLCVRVRSIAYVDSGTRTRTFDSKSPLRVPVGMLAEDFGPGLQANTTYTITQISEWDGGEWSALESQSGYFALQYCDRVADAATCTIASLLVAMLGIEKLRDVFGKINFRLRVRSVPATPDTDDHYVFPPAEEFERR